MDLLVSQGRRGDARDRAFQVYNSERDYIVSKPDAPVHMGARGETYASTKSTPRATGSISPSRAWGGAGLDILSAMVCALGLGLCFRVDIIVSSGPLPVTPSCSSFPTRLWMVSWSRSFSRSSTASRDLLWATSCSRALVYASFRSR